MQDRNACIRPPEDPVTPRQQSKELTARRNRRCTHRANKRRSVVLSESASLHAAAQDLQCEAPLAERTAQHHELVDLLLHRERAVEESSEDYGVDNDREWKPDANEKVADDDDWNLKGGGDSTVATNYTTAGCDGESGDRW
jgi:hypothetical protein